MNKNILFALSLMILSSAILASGSLAQTVDIFFWNDQNMNSQYLNNMMKVYFQNKTYAGAWGYNYTCYHSDYINGTAEIVLNSTGFYNLFITDGNLQWSNTTGCPTMVENYNFWSTVQSNMLIESDQTLNYYINVTITGEPRSVFWNTQSIRGIISALYWIACFVVIILIEWQLTKGGGHPSWILPIIIFIIFAIVKLSIGI